MQGIIPSSIERLFSQVIPYIQRFSFESFLFIQQHLVTTS
jgi:hypothetical protein